jgi:1-acyl-sn-glycerol-3-phosphate acyltransferase
LHVALAFAVAWLVFPVVPATARLALGQRWSVRLLGILGVRIPDEVGAVRPGSLIVANHVSWLDVIVLLALCPAAFVAKDELRRWLGLGWLFGRGGALYLKRGSARAAWRLNRTIAAGLAADTPVVIFPEGTTSDGARLLRFYPALFQPAVDGRHAVQPIALAYEDAAGAPCDAVVYAGDTPFWDSLLAIASERAIVARVRLAAPVDSARLTRREAARRTHEIIAQALAPHFAAHRRRPAPAEAQALSQSTSAPALAARSSSSMSG